MKVYELSYSYTPKTIITLDKMPSAVYKTKDGKTIFVTHGSEDETVLNKWLGDISEYDDICVCWANPEHRIMYHGWYWNKDLKDEYGNLRIFLLFGYDRELSLFMNNNARLIAVNNYLNSEENHG